MRAKLRLFLPALSAGVACANALAHPLTETVVFCADLEPRTAHLMFEPTRVLRVTTATGDRRFELGKDFTLDAHRRELRLTPHSGIPILQVYQAEPDSSHALLHSPAGWVYSWGGHEKHDRYDVTIEYETAANGHEWDELVQAHVATKILSPSEKFSRRRPLKFAFYGDSITHGSEASGFPAEDRARQSPPFQPSYPDEVVRRFRARHSEDPIESVNLSRPGESSLQAARPENLDRLNREHADIVVIAWGMNDGPAVPATDYEHNLRTIVDSLRAATPGVAIVLVAEMMPNPERGPDHMAAHAEHGRILARIFDDHANIALANVGAINRLQLQRKKFPDLLANGFNHPGDYVHRTYADAVTAALMPTTAGR